MFLSPSGCHPSQPSKINVDLILLRHRYHSLFQSLVRLHFFFFFLARIGVLPLDATDDDSGFRWFVMPKVFFVCCVCVLSSSPLCHHRSLLSTVYSNHLPVATIMRIQYPHLSHPVLGCSPSLAAMDALRLSLSIIHAPRRR